MTATLKRNTSEVIVPIEIFTQIIDSSRFTAEFSNTSAIIQKRDFEEEIAFSYEIAKNSPKSDFVNL